MAVILWKYGYGSQAHFVEDLLRLNKSSGPDFDKELASIAMWGGSGAVWEVGKFKEGSMSPAMQKEADEDELRFRGAIMTIAQFMKKNGIGSEDIRERSQFIADTFNHWSKKGL
jgi:hypothetical protein